MAATQLSLYNGALRLCSERKLASLTENREPRRLLDAAWGDGSTTGAVKYCLELGQWDFAMRGVMIDYSADVTPDFGYQYAFEQPSDLVRVAGVCSDECFRVPLLEYTDERRYWYADIEILYVRYVSNDGEYGADPSLWTEAFVKLVEAYLAKEIIGNLTQSKTAREDVEKYFDKLKKDAKSLDAMNTPTIRLPEGEWTASRRGNRAQGSRWNGSWS